MASLVNYLTPTVSTETVSTVFVESTTHESHEVESVELASVLVEQEARVAIATRAKNTFFIFFIVFVVIYCKYKNFFL